MACLQPYCIAAFSKESCMFKCIRKVSLCVGVLFLLPGCGELTQTITLNPDGKGKVVKDMYIAAVPLDFGGLLGGGEPKETPLDDVKKAAATNFLASKGVTAWKDVSVSWTNDGRLHLVGTAYFDKLGDTVSPDAKYPTAMMNPSAMMTSVFSSMQAFDVTVEKDGLKIAGKKTEGLPLNDAIKIKGQPPQDFAKLN